jgi:basic membrane protein A and related proteins
VRTPQLATRSVRVLAIPLLLAGLVAAVAPAASASAARTGGSSSSAATLPGGSSGTAAAGKFSGCLVTNTEGIHKGLNKVAWQGMQAAAAAEPSKIEVKNLVSQTASAYAPNIDTFIVEKCGLIVTVSSLMAPITESAAKANPMVKFAIVGCSYASGCLASPKLKNLISVKGTASAVKTLVLARANGT